MKELSQQLKSLKDKFLKKGQEDQGLRQDFKKALIVIFPEIENPLEFIKDFYYKQSILVIRTRNKSFANELFIRKNDLLLKLNKSNIIKDIVIN